jgi:hypothetical protein
MRKQFKVMLSSWLLSEIGAAGDSIEGIRCLKSKLSGLDIAGL